MCGEKEATQQTVLEDSEALPFHPPPQGAGSGPLEASLPPQACPSGTNVCGETLPSHMFLGTVLATLLDVVSSEWSGGPWAPLL